MKFVDEATIDVAAGHGGRGCKSFRREKFVPFGGPDGGDGGHGGSVILIADEGVRTLLDFKFQPRWIAEDGSPGQGSGKTGRSGKDLIIKLPVGTTVIKEPDGEVICDLAANGHKFVLAKGGKGGKGNEFFKTATNQVPEHTQPGEEGERGSYTLSLRLVADVGIIGLPNAGKSTLISVISAAKPKIADYPFTTLVPNLGVVRTSFGSSFVVADIPGLIPGAHAGKGLGIKFLKHIERTAVLAHLVSFNQFDLEGKEVDPLLAFEEINNELSLFSPELGARQQIVVISKADLAPDEKVLAKLVRRFESKGFETVVISAATGRGIKDLINLLSRQVGLRPTSANVSSDSLESA